MSRKLSYAIVGTGAIGGYYGAKLERSFRDNDEDRHVEFLLRSDYEYVKRNGLKINSVDGNFCLKDVSAFDNTERMSQADVILVCLKTTAEMSLKKMLPPLLKPSTIVLLIQNGIGVEEDVQQMFPEAQLAAGLAFICSTKTAPGVVDHTCYGSLNIGAYSIRDNDAMEQVIRDFEAANIKVRMVEYAKARWRKAVWNMPFNGLSVTHNALTDKLLSDPENAKIVRDTMMEVVSIARSLGTEGVDESFVEKMISTTLEMTPYAPSMRVDYDNGRPMELYYLYEKPIKMGLANGLALPCLCNILKELQEKAAVKGKEFGC